MLPPSKSGMTRPTVLINFAITADGKISTVNRDPAQFTSAQDLQRLLEIRKRADALLVGRGTLEADNMSMVIPPELKPSHQPLRCIASCMGDFDLGHRVFHTSGGAIHLLATTTPGIMTQLPTKPSEQPCTDARLQNFSNYLLRITRSKPCSAKAEELWSALS